MSAGATWGQGLNIHYWQSSRRWRDDWRRNRWGLIRITHRIGGIMSLRAGTQFIGKLLKLNDRLLLIGIADGEGNVLDTSLCKGVQNINNSLILSLLLSLNGHKHLSATAVSIDF